MLIDAGVDKKYWGEAVNTANYLQNLLPTRCRDKTPCELWYSRKPDIKSLHIFGSTAYAHIPKEMRKILDKKAEKFTFVRYSEETKGFRLLDIKTGTVKISRDVIFNDSAMQNTQDQEKVNKEVKINIPNVLTETEEETEDHITIEDDFSDRESNIGIEDNTENNEENLQENNMRRSDRNTKGVPPSRFMAGLNSILQTEEEPRSFKEAMQSSNKAKWRLATEEEMTSLKKKGTWKLIEPPEKAKIIGRKWVFKLKKTAEGAVSKYEARLVAQGFSQKFGIDLRPQQSC